MPETANLRRPARLALACLAATVLVPTPALLNDLRVREGAEAVQAAEDRLAELEPRLLGDAHGRDQLELAKDVALRRAVGEVMYVLHRHAGWVPDLDLVDLRLRIDRWFVQRDGSTAIADLTGAVHAAVRRSRAELRTARLVSLATVLAALVPALIGIFALLRLLRRIDRLSPRGISAPALPPAAQADAAPTPSVVLPALPGPTPLLRRTTAPESTPAVRPAGMLRGRVLVIEDNPINQRVTQRQLAELAVEVEIAPDAETGLVRMAEERWDAVLMDLQLPGIDGLTATRRWRAREASTGAKRVPIIAITANAMGSDRDACFAAGMDGYLAKPARLGDLYRALVRFIGAGTSAPSSSASAPIMPSASPRPVPPAALPLTDPDLWAKLRTETATSDPRMLEELVADLRAQVGQQLSEMTASHRAQSWEALRSVSHRLKGSAGMLGLPRLAAAAKGVEHAAKARDGDRATEALGDLALAISETLADPAVVALR